MLPTAGVTALRRPALLGVVVAVAAAVGLGVFLTRPANSVMDGVFTLEQARRGEALYPRSCPRCHRADLLGDGFETPALAGTDFTRRWSGRTVADLFAFVSVNMPKSSPGAWDGQTYVDLIAYILRMNGYPTGRRELPPDPEALVALRMEMLR